MRMATTMACLGLSLALGACSREDAPKQNSTALSRSSPAPSGAQAESSRAGASGANPSAPPPQPSVAAAPPLDPPTAPYAETSAEFAENAFPPTMPDTPHHADPWRIPDCLRCHETGVGDAPEVHHASGIPSGALSSKCRTCHVQIPGSTPRVRPPNPDDAFLAGVFPPMIPDSKSHADSWSNDSCIVCHAAGMREAPKLRHEGLSDVLLYAKCRTCHVQIRAAGLAAAD